MQKLFGTRARGSFIGPDWVWEATEQTACKRSKNEGAQRKERGRRNADEEERGAQGVQLIRGKNLRQGGSLDKDKADNATTNKPDPQDTTAGRGICDGFESDAVVAIMVLGFGGG